MKTDYSSVNLQGCLGQGEKIESLTLLAFTHTSTVLQATVDAGLSSRKMAIKIYNENSSPSPILSHLLRKPFKHIVNILSISHSQPCCVCMQLCSQDLKDLVKGRKESLLSREEAVRVGREIALGLLDLKSLKLMHGDLKPENILVDSSSTIKIGDLDFILREEEFTKKKIRVGTLQYMAPEVLSEWNCSYSSDVWSLGVVLYQLYFGQHPFPLIEELEPTKQGSMAKALSLIKQHLDKIRTNIKNEIKSCFQPSSNLLLQAMLCCLVWKVSSRGQIEEIAHLLQTEKQRKGSWSTDYSAIHHEIHHEDDIFMFPNTGLLLAFQKLHTILSSLPEEATKFREILHRIDLIANSQQQGVAGEELLVLRSLIEPKYKKMQRNFKRLANLQGGVSYSNKGQLFIHLQYLIELLADTANETCKTWIRENATKSAEFLG